MTPATACMVLVCLVACTPAVVAPAPARGAPCRHELPGPCASNASSFIEEVQPILEKRCFRCHTGDGPAADDHDFSKRERVVGQRRAIEEEIASCAMPPRDPLSDAEANTLLRWAACEQGPR
jgi:cytochrome c551/c552